MKKQLSMYSRKVYSICEVEVAKEKVDLLKELFSKRKESNDYISISNAVIVMKEMGFTIDEEKKLEIIEQFEKLYFRFDTLKKLFVFLNNKNGSSFDIKDEKTDYADAFIAVGGNEDLTGDVNVKDLRRIFKNFQIEMSVNSLLVKNGFSDVETVDFQGFCKLFSENLIDENKSFFSLISV